MATVTQRISEIAQPRGGYLPIKSFTKNLFSDGVVLHENENIHASLVGLAVDYLTRFVMGDSVDKAFQISCLGAANIGMLSKAQVLKSRITGLNDTSIISACKLAGFDVCYRASASSYKPVENINPDMPTIENIRTMVHRSITFWENYGPIICSELTFEGGYTNTVDSGDGDFLTDHTLWDFKVSKASPTSKHSLQILMYYIMGLHSIHSEYKQISNLGIFNPRLNIAYICPISIIPQETIDVIEKDVICYGKTAPSKQMIELEKEKTNDNLCEYSVADICRMTGIQKNTVYADIRSGKLQAHKQGNKYLVYQEDVINYIDKLKLIQSIRLCFLILTAVGALILFYIAICLT